MLPPGQAGFDEVLKYQKEWKPDPEVSTCIKYPHVWFTLLAEVEGRLRSRSGYYVLLYMGLVSRNDMNIFRTKKCLISVTETAEN